MKRKPDLLDSYRRFHQDGRKLAVQGPQKRRKLLFGMPWWVAPILVAVGILIGNLVIPYDDRKPQIRPALEPAAKPIPSICERDPNENLLLKRFPLCP